MINRIREGYSEYQVQQAENERQNAKNTYETEKRNFENNLTHIKDQEKVMKTATHFLTEAQKSINEKNTIVIKENENLITKSNKMNAAYITYNMNNKINQSAIDIYA